MSNFKKKFFIFGIKIDVTSDIKAFLTALEENLYFFRDINEKNEPFLLGKKIEIKFTREVIVDLKAINRTMSKIGHNAYLGTLLCSSRKKGYSGTLYRCRKI